MRQILNSARFRCAPAELCGPSISDDEVLLPSLKLVASDLATQKTWHAGETMMAALRNAAEAQRIFDTATDSHQYVCGYPI